MMKRPKLFKQNEESYWKSFTDIMSGLLLVILLVLMLFLLLMTQMDKNKGEFDKEYDNIGISNNDNTGKNDNTSNHKKDHDKENDYNDSGSSGSGEDDPGTKTQEGFYVDIGHDKTAVFVTVVDAETENVIKKDGILFELYASRNSQSGLQILHTYYPIKTEYKQYKTTEEGTFYLPEKITNGWYSLHNLKAPEGYGKAEDVSFEITESLDWSEPYLVTVPLAPEKAVIYVQNIDSVTKDKVSGGTYTVYASEDIVTLDGTVRYKAGEKVDTFKCDDTGKGQSKKLYLGKYKVIQSVPLPYYSLNKSELNVELVDEDDETIHEVDCVKTTATVKLTDEYSGTSIEGAVFSVTKKENLKTDATGMISISDIGKNKEYTVKLESVPSPYKISSDTMTFKVDKDGYIAGEAVASFGMTAYMNRLSVEVKDMIFDRGAAGSTVKLYNDSNVVVDEWESGNEPHMVEGIEPGEYTVEVKWLGLLKQKITVTDSATPHELEQSIWTWLDTGAVALALLMTALIIVFVVRIVRLIRKRKSDGKQKNKEK